VVQDYLAGRGVEWMFNIEKAPWWGGAFERMVKSTKRCLRKMVRRSRLSFDELHTALVEVESILNSRPLSYSSSSDLEEPLTPSHLLMGRRLLSLPDQLGYTADVDDEEFTVAPTSGQLSKRVRRLNDLLNHFWTRWRSEYLTELREAHRQANRNRAVDSSIVVSDVVVIHEENIPRGFWKLGRVEAVISGRDGKIRGAIVRLSSGSGILCRPVQLSYSLGVRSDAGDSDDDDLGPEPVAANPRGNVSTNVDIEADAPAVRNDSSTITDTPTTRPRQAAAFEARDRLKALTIEDD